MAAPLTALALLSLLCVAQAQLCQEYVTLRKNLQTARLAHDKLKAQYSSMVSNKLQRWAGIQELLREMRADLPPDFAVGGVMIDNLQSYSDMASHLLDEMILFLQTQVQQNQDLLENSVKYVELVEQQAARGSPLCHSFKRIYS